MRGEGLNAPPGRGLRRLRAALAGVRAAVRSARWVRDGDLRRLAAAPGPGASTGTSPGRAERAAARRAALLALRVLARLPGGRWRNSCLYRSVALCLLARRRGEDARLAFGVARAAGGTGELRAHAWVEDPGGDPEAGPAARPASAPAEGRTARPGLTRLRRSDTG